MTIKIKDQYELEPVSHYSGSTFDNIFSPGSILEGKRRVVHSKVNPKPSTSYTTNRNSINEKLLYITMSLESYYDIYQIPYGATEVDNNLYGLRGTPQTLTIQKFFESNDIYADSVLPSPVDIYLLNGGKLVEGDEGGYQSVGGYLNHYNISKSPRKFKIYLSTTSSHSAFNTHLTSSTDGSSISDNIWPYSFPFENTYSGLERHLKPGFLKEYPVEITQSSDRNPPYEITATSISAPGTVFSSSIYTVSYLKNNTSNVRNSHILAKTKFIITESNAYSIGPTEYPSIDLIYKGFFGFYSNGNGGTNTAGLETGTPEVYYNNGKFPKINGYLPSTSPAGGTHKEKMLISGVSINGWKYGIQSAIPTKTSCLYRSTKFGQLRDMLEQRHDTKFYSLKSGKAQPAAIIINFISGSNAKVTSSNPTVLNPTVSGIYDFEYKSGKPFDDTWVG